MRMPPARAGALSSDRMFSCGGTPAPGAPNHTGSPCGFTLWRAAIKFSDFWALDRDYVAGIQRGLFHPPMWAAVVEGDRVTALGGRLTVDSPPGQGTLVVAEIPIT